MLEDDKVAEVYLERPERRSIAGNIYLGQVDNVLPGMEAAFVEIGLEKNGFLYVDEIVGPEIERGHGRKIQDLISKGQTILVQAVKDPMKTKGARLTTQISLPGRFVVFVPQGEGLGVSRRLDDDERYAAEGHPEEAERQGGRRDRPHRRRGRVRRGHRARPRLPPARSGSRSRRRRRTATAPELIYQEAELPLRVTRDLFTGDFEKAYVDNDQAFKRITGYLKKTSPHMVERVVRYREKAPLMEAFGVEQEIKSTLSRRVDLPSGGYLIFDYAEAFTVIDVNTGRFVGSRGKNSGGAARGHDHEEQPRGGEGGRAPAPPARHRRDHRHRLHRHGEPEEPRDGRRGAAHRARARPDEDLRRRDLPARPRRDDASERHRRAARDHDAQVPDLRRRRHRLLRGVGRDRRRAPLAVARRGLALAGVPGRARGADRRGARSGRARSGSRSSRR